MNIRNISNHHPDKCITSHVWLCNAHVSTFQPCKEIRSSRYAGYGFLANTQSCLSVVAYRCIMRPGNRDGSTLDYFRLNMFFTLIRCKLLFLCVCDIEKEACVLICHQKIEWHFGVGGYNNNKKKGGGYLQGSAMFCCNSALPCLCLFCSTCICPIRFPPLTSGESGLAKNLFNPSFPDA